MLAEVHMRAILQILAAEATKDVPVQPTSQQLEDLEKVFKDIDLAIARKFEFADTSARHTVNEFRRHIALQVAMARHALAVIKEKQPAVRSAATRATVANVLRAVSPLPAVGEVGIELVPVSALPVAISAPKAYSKEKHAAMLVYLSGRAHPKTLDQMYQKFGVNIVDLPVGRASSLGDVRALARIINPLHDAVPVHATAVEVTDADLLDAVEGYEEGRAEAISGASERVAKLQGALQAYDAGKVMDIRDTAFRALVTTKMPAPPIRTLPATSLGKLKAREAAAQKSIKTKDRVVKPVAAIALLAAAYFVIGGITCGVSRGGDARAHTAIQTVFPFFGACWQGVASAYNGTAVSTPTASMTVVPAPGSITRTASETRSAAVTSVPTHAGSGTASRAASATFSPALVSDTSTDTGSRTASSTPSATPAVTASVTASVTVGSTNTGTGTASATSSPTPSVAASVTAGSTNMGTGTASVTLSLTPTVTALVTASVTAGSTNTGTGTVSGTATHTGTDTASGTITTTPSSTPASPSASPVCLSSIRRNNLNSGATTVSVPGANPSAACTIFVDAAPSVRLTDNGNHTLFGSGFFAYPCTTLSLSNATSLTPAGYNISYTLAGCSPAFISGTLFNGVIPPADVSARRLQQDALTFFLSGCLPTVSEEPTPLATEDSSVEV